MREVSVGKGLPQAEFLCGLLRDQGIDAQVATTHMAETYALGTPVPVLVPDEQVVEARRILEEASLLAPAAIAPSAALAPEPDLRSQPEEAIANVAGDGEGDEADVADGEEPDVAAPVEPRRRALFGEFLGVVFVLVGWIYAYDLVQPFVGYPEPAWSPEQTTINSAVRLAQTLVLLWLVRLWRHEPAATFGLVRPRWSDLGLGLVALAATFLADILFHWWMNLQWAPPAGLPSLGPTFGVAACVLVGIVLDAVFEEALWRGYAISRQKQALGSSVFAVLVSAILFGVAHAYQGWFGVLSATFLGIVWGIFFLRVRRIGPLVVAHATWNVLQTGW